MSPDDKAHAFGGLWTDEKLRILQRYLCAFTQVLKNQRWDTVYIDAFAGTGSRVARKSLNQKGGLPFEEADTQAAEAFLEGSVRVALKTDPPFGRYVFIEKDQDRCAELEKLRGEFPHLASSLEIKQGDANEQLLALCKENWNNQRGVLFLDPYGTQVHWSTLEAVAKTEAIDVWILFPLGPVNRMLPKHGPPPEEWAATLDRLFGNQEWRHVFYRKTDSRPSLFNDLEDGEEVLVREGFEKIGEYFLARLKEIFPGVAPHPRTLSNSKGAPLYLFCFAMANPSEKARKAALRIANHILDKIG